MGLCGQFGLAAPFAVAPVPINLHTLGRLAPAAETLYKCTMGTRKKTMISIRQEHPARVRPSYTAPGIFELIRE